MSTVFFNMLYNLIGEDGDCMKKIWLGLLSLFMSVHLLGLSSFSIVAANKAITTTYAKAYDTVNNVLNNKGKSIKNILIAKVPITTPQN